VPRIVVDASVAVKWFFREVGFERALALRQREAAFIAPELVVAEIGNAAWNKHIRNEINADDAMFAVRNAPLLFTQLVPLTGLSDVAMRFALELRQPIYDCFYLALAQAEQTALVTDDEAMIAAGRKARIDVQRI
jgi:predicted nucleic acid-binding protein